MPGQSGVSLSCGCAPWRGVICMDHCQWQGCSDGRHTEACLAGERDAREVSGLDPRCRNRQGKHKDGYASWDDAERACYELREVSAYPVLFAYRAPCGQYHTGHASLRPPPRQHRLT